MKLLQVLSILFALSLNVMSYKILAVLPVTSKSHYYIGGNLMKAMAEQGHEVTVISPFSEEKPISNFTEVLLETSWEKSRQSKFNY